MVGHPCRASNRHFTIDACRKSYTSPGTDPAIHAIIGIVS
jgi:hypothetical protein